MGIIASIFRGIFVCPFNNMAAGCPGEPTPVPTMAPVVAPTPTAPAPTPTPPTGPAPDPMTPPPQTGPNASPTTPRPTTMPTPAPTFPPPSPQPTAATVSSSNFRLTFNGVPTNPPTADRDVMTNVVQEAINQVIRGGIESGIITLTPFRNSYLFTRATVVNFNSNTVITYRANLAFNGSPVASSGDANDLVDTTFRVPSFTNLGIGFNQDVVNAIRALNGNAYSSISTLNFVFV